MAIMLKMFTYFLSEDIRLAFLHRPECNLLEDNIILLILQYIFISLPQKLIIIVTFLNNDLFTVQNRMGSSAEHIDRWNACRRLQMRANEFSCVALAC